MQTTITAQTPEGKAAVAWLHKTGSKTLVVLLHGHNSEGTRGRFITLAKWFEHHGLDCLRWNCVRPLLDDDTYGVTTVSDELTQVRALIDKVRANYDRVIAVGHSQAGLIVLKLGTEGRADAVVSLMGVVNVKHGVQSKLERFGADLSTLDQKGAAEMKTDYNQTFVYSRAFFDDLLLWNVEELFRAWHGPTLFFAGSRDTSIPPAEVAEGFALANEPKKLVTVDDVHNFSNETAMHLAKEIVAWAKQ